MRALCGAIISAGALICLGLSAIGFGTRYSAYPYLDQAGNPHWVKFRDIDTSLMLVLIAGLLGLGVGLGVAFVGLAYHHHRRHHEMLHLHQPPTEQRPVA
jgi:hypothetical protein